MDKNKIIEPKTEFLILNVFQLSQKKLSHEQVVLSVKAFENIKEEFSYIFEGSMVTKDQSEWCTIMDTNLLPRQRLETFFFENTTLSSIEYIDIKKSKFCRLFCWVCKYSIYILKSVFDFHLIK